MPKTPIDYSKTVIYKIVCNDLNTTDLYVGHTTDFTKRKNCHKSDCNNINNKSYNLKVYKMIRENGNWENWTMIEIEKYPCDDSNQACARERYWYEVLNANLNSRNPSRSKKESDKAYYELNKEKIHEMKSEKFTCECGGKCTRVNKSTHFKSSKHLKFCNSTILDV
jgi:predicted GIY-YIG superfamily endonuclease